MPGLETRRITLAIEGALVGEAGMRALNDVKALPFERFDVLNLSFRSVEQLDVSGIAILVRVVSHLRRLGKRVNLVEVSDVIAGRLANLGFDGVLDIQRRTALRSNAAAHVSRSDLIPGR